MNIELPNVQQKMKIFLMKKIQKNQNFFNYKNITKIFSTAKNKLKNCFVMRRNFYSLLHIEQMNHT